MFYPWCLSRVIASVVLFVSYCLVHQGHGVATTPQPPTTPPPPHKPCSSFSSCEKCVENVSCLWCQTNTTCLDYPVRHLLPPSSVCQLSHARWGVCWVNFEALIIAMAVVVGTILLSVTACCCCCWCRRPQSGRPEMEREESYTRRQEEIRRRANERKVERKVKHDEIRKKYGLVPDSDHPYSKFEND